jgi:hypothetical protein
MLRKQAGKLHIERTLRSGYAQDIVDHRGALAAGVGAQEEEIFSGYGN